MCIIVVDCSDEVDVPSADSPPHVGSSIGISPTHVGSTTSTHIDADATRHLNSTIMSNDATTTTAVDQTTVKLRSELRQTLTYLLSMAYEVNDNELLSSTLATVQQQVDLYTARLGGHVMPRCNKRRVRKHAKKTTAKRRRVRGNTSADVDC